MLLWELSNFCFYRAYLYVLYKDRGEYALELYTIFGKTYRGGESMEQSAKSMGHGAGKGWRVERLKGRKVERLNG
jgi:hypothetical protein